MNFILDTNEIVLQFQGSVLWDGLYTVGYFIRGAMSLISNNIIINVNKLCLILALKNDIFHINMINILVHVFHVRCDIQHPSQGILSKNSLICAIEKYYTL